MTGHSGETSTRRRSLGRLPGAIAVRAAFWGGLAMVALLLLGPSWWGRPAIPPTTPPPPADDGLKPEAGAVPGWPNRRGPRHDGTSPETRLADSWPPEGPPLLWTRDLGRGYSGFTAVGGRVWTQSQSLTRQSVLCLDADTGTTVWQHDYAWPYEAAGMYPGPRATPTFADRHVYFADPDGRVGCLWASDGRPVWSIDVNAKFGGRGADFGYACSPLVEAGKVILPVGGKGASVVALDRRDGSTVWTSGDDPASYASALPITLDGRRLVVAFLQNALAIVELETGRLLWRQEYSHGYDEHAAAPLYAEPYLVAASPFHAGADCYRLVWKREEAESPGVSEAESPTIVGTLVWHSDRMSNDTASSILIDGHVYGFDLRDVQAKAQRPSRGEFRCLELATGQVRWSTDRTGHATVIAADGKLILWNDRGELLMARASPEGYEELARTEVFGNEICWTAPALADGRLYLRSPTRAACVFVGTPERLASLQLGRVRATSEMVGPKRWNLARWIGGERPYAMDPPDLAELARWYGFSLVGVLGVAAAIAGLVCWPLGRRWPPAARPTFWAVFWSAASVGGAVGTPIYNRLFGPFVFTWPVCLFVAHQLALMAIVWARRRPEVRRGQGISALAVLLLLAVCLGYYAICRRLSLAPEWTFLLGFIPSWPLAVPAAYRLQGQGRWWRDLLWIALSFSAFFWAAGGYLLWRAATLG